MELPVVQDKDWAKQAAEKSLKVGWAETDTCRFSLTRAHSHLVPAQVGTITDADGVTHRIRITRIEDDGGVRLIEAKRERSNTYNSNAQGSLPPAPVFPGTPLRGPTDGLLMLLPPLRDGDTGPGLYWAARGYLSGWQGAVLQIQRTDWVTMETVTLPATMGELTAPLAIAGTTLSVTASEPLASTTSGGIAEGLNAAAILYADGTAEIVQWETATQTAPGAYDLTGLHRGRLDTVTGDHATGARFVVLDGDVRFIPLLESDVGTLITYRSVSIGTDADAAPSQTIQFDWVAPPALETEPSNRITTDGDYRVTADGSLRTCRTWQ